MFIKNTVFVIKGQYYVNVYFIYCKNLHVQYAILLGEDHFVIKFITI